MAPLGRFGSVAAGVFRFASALRNALSFTMSLPSAAAIAQHIGLREM